MSVFEINMITDVHDLVDHDAGTKQCRQDTGRKFVNMHETGLFLVLAERKEGESAR